MEEIVNFLIYTPIDSGLIKFTWIEIIGFLSGASCVWLVVKQNPLNWPVGLIQVISYLVLFWHYGLFGDSLLQIVYIILGIYGWLTWKYGGNAKTKLEVSLANSKHLYIQLISLTMLFGATFYWLVNATTSSVPFWDALTTSLCLVATYGQVKKHVQSWYFWIAADIIYIPLYLYKELAITSILYAVFLALCIKGLRQWKSDLALAVHL